MKKYILLILVAAILLTTWFFYVNGNGDQGQRQKVLVEAYRADQQVIHDSVEALGTAYANESIDITANDTETIDKIHFADGQEVKKGDIIVTLAQNEEQAQLKAAKARLAENQRELKRLKALLKSNAAAKRQYDERKTMLEIAKHEIQEIEAKIGDRTLRAPFDGVLGLRRLSEGALVQPGNIITTLDDVKSIKLDFNVPDIYLSNLYPGIAINATSPSYGEREFKGAIFMLDSRVDPATRSILVRAIINNHDDMIKPGVLMKVNLLKDERFAITVPEEAVIQKGDKHFVMQIDKENKVMTKEVKIGTRKSGIVEITEGLEQGDRIVLRGVHKVRDGMEVEVVVF